MIEQSISLNTAMYLLVKSFLVEDDETAQDIDSHPVMLQLKMASVLMQKLVDNTVKKTANLDEQVKSLVKAAALLVDVGEDMQENNVNQNAKPTQGKRKSLVVESDTVQTPTPAKSVDLKPNSRSRQGVLDEVRFGLREHEIDQKTKLKRRKAPVFSDLGDSNDDGTASRSLAATINAIDQRAAAKSKKRKPEKSTEDTDFHEEDFEVTDGIRRMEDELEGTHQMDSLQDSAGEATDDSGDHLMDEGDDDMNFYKIMAEKSKRKKQIKEQMHQVAPKFPTMESEVSGMLIDTAISVFFTSRLFLTFYSFVKVNALLIGRYSRTEVWLRTKPKLIEILESRSGCNIAKLSSDEKVLFEKYEQKKDTNMTVRGLVLRVESLAVESWCKQNSGHFLVVATLQTKFECVYSGSRITSSPTARIFVSCMEALPTEAYNSVVLLRKHQTLPITSSTGSSNEKGISSESKFLLFCD